MRIILAPDKFKFSLTAIEFCEAASRGIIKAMPLANIYSYPLSDGGDGFVDVMKGSGDYQLRSKTVSDPLFRPIEAHYLLDRINKTAVIEMALCSGLGLLSGAERNCMNTSTFGVGELIKDALDQGVDKIVLGLGGSATNDGGTGMASALGFRFLDEKSNEIKPVGRNLLRISSIQVPEIDNFSACKFEVITDVSNPFYGQDGAAKIYGPQKGASPHEVNLLDQGLEHFAHIIERDLGIAVAKISGSGAAGGLGGGSYAFLNASIVPGTEYIMQVFGFDELLKNADLVITGEGRMDTQSIFGKLPVELAKRAFKADVPVIAIAGSIEKEIRDMDYFWQMYALSDIALSKEDAIENAEKYIEEIAYNHFLQLKG